MLDVYLYISIILLSNCHFFTCGYLFQALLIDLEVWLTEVQVSLNNDLQLTSLKVVRDQIRGCQVGSYHH